MQNELMEWEKGGYWDYSGENYPEIKCFEDGLPFSDLEDETSEDRTTRIISIMEKSNARLSHILGVLERIS